MLAEDALPPPALLAPAFLGRGRQIDFTVSGYTVCPVDVGEGPCPYTVSGTSACPVDEKDSNCVTSRNWRDFNINHNTTMSYGPWEFCNVTLNEPAYMESEWGTPEWNLGDGGDTLNLRTFETRFHPRGEETRYGPQPYTGDDLPLRGHASLPGDSFQWTTGAPDLSGVRRSFPGWRICFSSERKYLDNAGTTTAVKAEDDLPGTGRRRRGTGIVVTGAPF